MSFYRGTNQSLIHLTVSASERGLNIRLSEKLCFLPQSELSSSSSAGQGFGSMESVSFRKSDYIARRVRFPDRSIIRPLLEVLCEYKESSISS